MSDRFVYLRHEVNNPEGFGVFNKQIKRIGWRLVYIYHSGFVVEAEGFSILIDYFKDTNPGPAKGFVRVGAIKTSGDVVRLSIISIRIILIRTC